MSYVLIGVLAFVCTVALLSLSSLRSKSSDHEKKIDGMHRELLCSKKSLSDLEYRYENICGTMKKLCDLVERCGRAVSVLESDMSHIVGDEKEPKRGRGRPRKQK